MFTLPNKTHDLALLRFIAHNDRFIREDKLTFLSHPVATSNFSLLKLNGEHICCCHM